MGFEPSTLKVDRQALYLGTSLLWLVAVYHDYKMYMTKCISYYTIWILGVGSFTSAKRPKDQLSSKLSI
jgi:hypothetical protein